MRYSIGGVAHVVIIIIIIHTYITPRKLKSAAVFDKHTSLLQLCDMRS